MKYRITFSTEESLPNGDWREIGTEDCTFEWYEDFHPTNEHLINLLDQLYSSFNKSSSVQRRLLQIKSCSEIEDYRSRIDDYDRFGEEWDEDDEFMDDEF